MTEPPRVPPGPVAHPFADLLGFEVEVPEPGRSRAVLVVRPEHHNSNGVPHGAVSFAGPGR